MYEVAVKPSKLTKQRDPLITFAVERRGLGNEIVRPGREIAIFLLFKCDVPE